MKMKAIPERWRRSAALVRRSLVAASLVASASPLWAQDTIQPDPDDVESIDAIIAALYDVISGPAGEKLDWDRFRSLYLPGAHLVPSVVTPDGTIRHVVWAPEEYIQNAGAQLEEVDFFESEIGRVTEEFGNIAHVFSTYESRAEEDGDPVQRGINSIQLFWDGGRWWIANIVWTQERDDNQIPNRYLSEGGS